MKTFLHKISKEKIVIILLLFLVIPSFATLIRPGFFFMQDDLQAFRIQQMDKCIQNFQIPCRWVPDAGYQYGYPQFNYYSPSAYYLGEMIHLLGFQFIDAVKILFALGFVVGALTMFILLRAWLGLWPAFVGAILYTYVPYKAVDVYVRGAMSEFWGLALFPLVFWAIYQLVKTEKLKYFFWLSFSLGLLLITHNLMSFIFLPLLAVWSLVWIYLEKKWSLIPLVLLGGVLGLGFSAFFTLPVIFERQFVHIESMFGGYFDYRQHFVDLNQIFLSNNWGYGSSYLGPGDDLSLSTGIIQWLAGLLAVILSVISFKKNRKIALITLAIAFVNVIVLFLTHQKSSFIWEKISFLATLQFPWRFLGDSIFLLAILSGVAVYLLGKLSGLKASLALGLVLILSVFALYLNFFQPKDWFSMTDQEKFSGALWEKQLTISIFDYLPIYATLPPNHKAPLYPEVLDGEAVFSSYIKGDNYQTGTANVTKEATVRLPLLDFPGMTVKVDGQKIPHRHDDCRLEEYCFGLISFGLTPGQHVIETRLTDTPIRTVGNILSLISIIAIATIAILAKTKK